MRSGALVRGKGVRLILLALLLTVVLAGAPAAGISSSFGAQFAPTGLSLDSYGGYPGLKAPATGYFYVKQMTSGGQTHWWFVDPLGNAYYADGVSLVTPAGLVDVNGSNPYSSAMKSKYGNPVNLSSWASDAEDRLRAWGYNALGSWSSTSLYSKFPHTAELAPLLAAVQQVNPTGDRNLDQYPVLYEETTPEWDAMYRRYFFDVFHPLFQQVASNSIASAIASNGFAADTNLIGYFADNEVPLWHGRSTNPSSPWYNGNTLADVFIALPATAYGKIEWVNHLRGIYGGSISALNGAWGGVSYASFDDLLNVNSVPSTNLNRTLDKVGFLQKIVAKYFSTVRNAIKSADPNHLYLGTRFVTGPVSTPYGVYVEAGKYLDVISVNYYVWDNKGYSDMKSDLDARFNEIWSNAKLGAPDPNAGVPILVTEFSFAGRDSGMPATNLNGAIVDTQEQRAQLYANYQRASVESPYVVGDYWWSYFDPPATGNRIGKEDSNLGLVDNGDRPYLRMLSTHYGESPKVYSYRGLTAPSRPVLSSASAVSTYSGLSTASSSISAEKQPGEGSPAAGAPLALTPRLYLPLITRNSQGVAQTTFYVSLASPVSSLTIEIYDGNAASATLKRTLTATSLAAGSQSIPWDGLDQNGSAVWAGRYFFIMKTIGSGGQKDYAMGSFTR